MIYVLISNRLTQKKLRRQLEALNVSHQFLDLTSLEKLEVIFANLHSAKAIIVERSFPNILPQASWLSLLEGINKQVPVVVLDRKTSKKSQNQPGLSQVRFWNGAGDLGEVLKHLPSIEDLTSTEEPAIQLYNRDLPKEMLRRNGFLSVVMIDATSFRKVAMEYGNEVYGNLQCFLVQSLQKTVGTHFRKSDILYRTNPEIDIFVILLDKSRLRQDVPLPGDLEKLADRLSTHLDNIFWEELQSQHGKNSLPKFFEIIPKYEIGFGTAIYNPCISPSQTIEDLLNDCRKTARTQKMRKKNRHQELIQLLIHSENILTPHYQAVIHAQSSTVKEVREAVDKSSLLPLKNAIYGFEALVRVNRETLHRYTANRSMLVEPQHLNPAVLFSLADEVNLTLELDQACFKQSFLKFGNLPGKLLANILPRNFYHMDQFKHLIPKDMDLTFEVSESEAIRNLGLLLKIRKSLSNAKFGIAIDDFGTGYASLGRVITLRPEIIKFDRSLISNIHKDATKKAFVESLIHASRSTQSAILAEGVELIEEFEVLKQIGVDLIQGFLVHRPESVTTILEQLEIKKPKKPYDTVA